MPSFCGRNTLPTEELLLQLLQNLACSNRHAVPFAVVCRLPPGVFHSPSHKYKVYARTIGRLIILNLNHFHILTIYILLYESTSLSYVYKSKYLPQMRQLSLLQFPYSSLRKYTRGTDSIIITIHPFAGRHTKQDIQTSMNAWPV